MDKLESMALFVRVAEMGSFSAVARQKGIARSIVTRQIAHLENTLGVKLLTRSTRSVSLTSHGTAYLEQCRAILDLVEAAETGLAEAHQAPRGNLRLSLPLSYGLKRLAPALLEFAQAYPEVSLEMDYTDRRVDLVEEGIDLGIRITRQLTGTDIVRRIGTVHMRAVAAPGYLARHGWPRHPSDLAHHACLSYSSQGRPAVWEFWVGGAITEFPIRSRIHANNGEVLTEAAARELGITYQPDFIVDDSIASGRIVKLLDDYPAVEMGIYAMLPSNRQIPYRVRVLLDFLAERVGAWDAVA
jgi:DNA-binding transcriptional LysR family regulator